ncbi:hypothetical protein SAMN05216516_10636 [Izhakiella capsodis]|uniref:Uncharacterized protein n=1 Tax=Izhakiella capsodis TaxID=1367852 RepID=A0A1I4YCH1_9GAMM|nr:hypothetical protein [Izhakiella capsodis]SFN35755.1 hypothetical protein SAMN05216516_10636 [Izhakiella capsodis]
MNVNNYLLKIRAIFFNSSAAAFKSGCRNPEARGFYTNLIKVKNDNARSYLTNVNLSNKKRAELLGKIKKYNRQEYILSLIDKIISTPDESRFKKTTLPDSTVTI